MRAVSLQYFFYFSAAFEYNANAHYLFIDFKQETGKAMMQFINEEKINKACYYLTFTDKSPIEISICLSFSSQRCFQSIIKKIMGITPTEWRRKNTAVKWWIVKLSATLSEIFLEQI